MSRRPKTGDAREADWLKVRGFDGLYHPDATFDCGCVIGDLRPCGETETPCRGGYANGDGIYQPPRQR